MQGSSHLDLPYSRDNKQLFDNRHVSKIGMLTHQSSGEGGGGVRARGGAPHNPSINTPVGLEQKNHVINLSLLSIHDLKNSKLNQ